MWQSLEVKKIWGPPDLEHIWGPPDLESIWGPPDCIDSTADWVQPLLKRIGVVFRGEALCRVEAFEKLLSAAIHVSEDATPETPPRDGDYMEAHLAHINKRCRAFARAHRLAMDNERRLKMADERRSALETVRRLTLAHAQRRETLNARYSVAAGPARGARSGQCQGDGVDTRQDGSATASGTSRIGQIQEGRADTCHDGTTVAGRAPRGGSDQFEGADTCHGGSAGIQGVPRGGHAAAGGSSRGGHKAALGATRGGHTVTGTATHWMFLAADTLPLEKQLVAARTNRKAQTHAVPGTPICKERAAVARAPLVVRSCRCSRELCGTGSWWTEFWWRRP